MNSVSSEAPSTISGRRERQDEQEVDRLAAPDPVAHERDRDERPEDVAITVAIDAISQAEDQRVDERLVGERVQPVVERELLPDHVEAARRAR